MESQVELNKNKGLYYNKECHDCLNLEESGFRDQWKQVLRLSQLWNNVLKRQTSSRRSPDRSSSEGEWRTEGQAARGGLVSMAPERETFLLQALGHVM